MRLILLTLLLTSCGYTIDNCKQKCIVKHSKDREYALAVKYYCNNRVCLDYAFDAYVGNCVFIELNEN